MPALFSPRANRRMRFALALILAAVLGVPAFLMGWVRTPYERGQYHPVAQPIAFSHTLHVRGMRIDCRYCHSTVERSPWAGVPPTSVCVPCHTQTWLQSPFFAPVRASMATGKPVPWVRVTQLPDFVYFDHSIHVAKGVGCESCHGRVDAMDTVYQARSLTMGWCLDCHRNPEQYLRPVEQVTTMGYTPPRPQLALGKELVERYHVRRLTNCTACHR
jgi:hypothetical protein